MHQANSSNRNSADENVNKYVPSSINWLIWIVLFNSNFFLSYNILIGTYVRIWV
jgi:hypothetical protein